MSGGILKTAVSGIRAAQTKLNVSANNTANINTRSYKKKVVSNETLAGGGVRTRIRVINTPGAPVYDIVSGKLEESSNVSLVEESVNMISALTELKSNAKAIRAHDEILGTIINISAK